MCASRGAPPLVATAGPIVNGSLVLHTPQEFPQVGPQNLLGIEINPYAAELARVTIWIGQIQWMLAHGLGHVAQVAHGALGLQHFLDALKISGGEKRA